jgi:hypothetical protein
MANEDPFGKSPNGPRHDLEKALHSIKKVHADRPISLAEDADDEAREFVRRVEEERAKVRQAAEAREAAKKSAGRYTLEDVADLLEREAGVRRAAMLTKLKDAALAKSLPTYEPGHQERIEYGTREGEWTRVRDFHDEAYWDDLNAWLDTNEPRVSWRFPAPAAAARTRPSSVAGDSPSPLETTQIAIVFDGLRYRAEKWKKPLGDQPKWLKVCIVVPGERGVRQAQWNPVLIGAALVRNGHVTARSVRARFQAQLMLKPWLDAWKTYEADNFETD